MNAHLLIQPNYIHTTPTNSICDGKGYGAFSVVLPPCMHAVMKLSNDGDGFFGTAVFCHDSPKAVSTECVKCLGQINISWVEVRVLFLTLLLQLSCSKHHVNSPHVLYGSRIDFPVRVHVRDCCWGDLEGLWLGSWKQGDSAVIIACQ